MGSITKIIFVFAIIIGLLFSVVYFKNIVGNLPAFRLGGTQQLSTATPSAILKPTTLTPVQTEDMVTLKKSIYEDFNKQEYDSALAAGKIVVLNFYANWCPICRAEAPEVEAGFNSLNPERVAAFRVSYKDDETTAEEKALADQFQIPYQHTKVILKNNRVVYKETVQWSREDVAKEVNKVL